MRLALVLFILMTWSSVQAAAQDSERLSRSISYINEDARVKSLDQADYDAAKALEQFGFRDESTAITRSLVTTRCDCDVSVYDVSTILIEDLDYNGFYHRFKVIIDADTRSLPGLWVYARLYLSYEGGPWNHYATSGDFFVEGETSSDEFVVLTELTEGYPTGYYDIRVELFDAEFENLLRTIGPYDDSSLNAVPLEDRERDDSAYYDGHVVAGSTQAGFLLLLLALAAFRFYSLTGKPALRQPRKPSE